MLVLIIQAQIRRILNDISLTIPVNSMVGFVGLTGSGKTTLVDIILGLLESQKGSLKVDGAEINSKNIINWQRKLGLCAAADFINRCIVGREHCFWC